ncbi:MAG: DNA-binding response regulator [Planctomycetaceae bacterium]|nr:MAG: DNA-binding response regulator [Planctomycetaceae bacterium]
MRSIRIVLADDHHLVRAGLRALIERSPGLEVVGEAEDGRQVVQLAENLQPDIVLMDIAMPEMNGLTAALQLRTLVPHTRVIIVSMNSTVDSVLRAMRAGVAGYLLKNVSPSELELAVQSVAKGQTYLCAAASQHVIDGYVQNISVDSDVLERLTPRQREVLQLVAEGFTTKEIAGRLRIAPKTVETHRTQLMRQLQIRDLAGLVRFAVQSGLVSLGD